MYRFVKTISLILLLAGSMFALGCAAADDVANGSGSSSSSSSSQPVLPTVDISSANFNSYQISLDPHQFRVYIISNHTEALVNNESGWWHDAVVYQVFSSQFNGGALPTSRLGYITNVGFTAVWTTPIFTSPSEHGYDTSDYSNVKASFGGNGALTTYISDAHNAGVKVILDMVINHTSDQMQWFIDSVNQANGKDDWYVWTNRSETLLDGDGWQSAWGGGGSASSVWHYSSTRGDDWHFYGAFWSGMPDLNFNNTDVRNTVKAIAGHWLNQGVDGFRLDAGRYMIETGPYPGQADTSATKDWWVEYQSYLKGVKSDAMTVGEL